MNQLAVCAGAIRLTDIIDATLRFLLLLMSCVINFAYSFLLKMAEIVRSLNNTRGYTFVLIENIFFSFCIIKNTDTCRICVTFILTHHYIYCA